MSSNSVISNGPVIEDACGRRPGAVRRRSLDVFRGVPYAESPDRSAALGAAGADGALERRSAMRTHLGPACYQPATKLNNIYAGPPMPMSEDCLSLNIWMPKHARNAPVFFWIYGGALWSGASRDPMYDGRKLAERGVIVVSINYRVGVLGWLAHPQLSAAVAAWASRAITACLTRSPH